MVFLCSLSEQRGALSKLESESPALPRVTPIPPAVATTTSPCSSPVRKTLPSGPLAPSLRSYLPCHRAASQPPPCSPAWLLSQGTPRCYPWGNGPQLGHCSHWVQSRIREGQGRHWECPRCHTGRLCPPPPSPPPSLASYLSSPRPHLDRRPSPVPSRGSSTAWGNAAVAGWGSG